VPDYAWTHGSTLLWHAHASDKAASLANAVPIHQLVITPADLSASDRARHEGRDLQAPRQKPPEANELAQAESRRRGHSGRPSGRLRSTRHYRRPPDRYRTGDYQRPKRDPIAKSPTSHGVHNATLLAVTCIMSGSPCTCQDYFPHGA